MDEQFSWRKTVGKELGALWKIPMIQNFPLHRFIVMKGSVIYELYETWCCESTNTVDGSEIRGSPVDMAVSPMIYKGFIHPTGGCLFGISEPSNSITIMQKNKLLRMKRLFVFVGGTNFNLSEPALSVMDKTKATSRLRACRASDEWRTCFFFLRIVGRGAWNV